VADTFSLRDETPAICETGTILTSTSDEFTNSFNINVLGPIILFQSIHDLLLKSTLEKGPVFTIISTAAGQISAQLADVRVAPYAVSKVAVNMVVKRIQLEHPDIISLAIQ
jgi:NAD(P)-dependent dehydrogenase (short-subunit alcohol dehydrogenase family)